MVFMKKQDFYFQLPPELIAQYPLTNRSESRLLVYKRNIGNLGHYQFKDLIHFLNPGDVLVMNDTKVIPARLHGHKVTGGKVELLVERIYQNNIFLAHIKSKTLSPNSIIYLNENYAIKVLGKQDDMYHCEMFVKTKKLIDILNKIGHIPLPPYIMRKPELNDHQTYQTVYAINEGSIAAPTAGLHFDHDLILAVKNKGINLAYTTLHIGAGTFKPVRCDAIVNHKMHKEQFFISNELAYTVNKARASGNKVIAVGTSTMRSLESAAVNGMLTPCMAETDIFIYPGYNFRICDGLITNFHLPASTLLMLVAAFIGHTQAMALYAEAIAQQYRFFSYGDASLLI